MHELQPLHRNHRKMTQAPTGVGALFGQKDNSLNYLVSQTTEEKEQHM